MLMNSTNKREGYEKTNKVIDNMNEEILKLNNRVNELLLNLNDYDNIKKENKEYQENISSLQNTRMSLLLIAIVVMLAHYQ